jgi:hypothetical protein
MKINNQNWTQPMNIPTTKTEYQNRHWNANDGVEEILYEKSKYWDTSDAKRDYKQAIKFNPAWFMTVIFPLEYIRREVPLLPVLGNFSSYNRFCLCSRMLQNLAPHC